MADAVIHTPYATVLPYLTSSLSGWADEYDAQRLASYDLYDDFYNTDPTQANMLLRGTDERPIYIPLAKRIINSLARYVGKDWGYTVLNVGTSSDQENAKTAFGELFKRENVLSQFTSAKKEWLRRGDWVWYLSADPNKAPGSRLSLRCIDPRMYFQIPDETDNDRISGAELIEETTVGDKLALKVQRWIKSNNPDHPSFGQAATDIPFNIWHDVIVYDLDGFSDPTKRKILAQQLALTELPGITALPLYHIKNNAQTGDPWGHSDLSGIESLFAGVNQATSDEDLTLALMGIGQYWTDSGAPQNEDTGEIEDWKLGPNRVIEVDENTSFNKVDGVNSIQPFQDHINFIQAQAFGVNSLSDVAVGSLSADSHASQLSGVALAIHMQPTFDAADEKDDAINSVMTQLFHDLKDWFKVYESIDLGDAEILSVVDVSKRLPFDVDAEFNRLMTLYTAGAITTDYLLSQLQDRMGYDFPPNMLSQVQAEQASKAALADPYGARVANELGSPAGATPADQAAQVGAA